MKRDIHQEVTDSIIAAIEAGTEPWKQEWEGNIGVAMPKRCNGESYRGINILLLWLSSMANGFESATWLTFNQAKKDGGMVRKGQKGTKVVYYGTGNKKDGNGEEDRFFFMKQYTVFNVDQIDGLGDKYAAPAPMAGGGESVIADLETFFANTGAKIRTGKQIAPHWNPMTDVIGMPPVEAFVDAQAYYGTLAHELTHWTGHTPRLDRDMKYNTKEGRAFEELIAEIGACFICAHIGATPNRENSASYIQSWLKALKSDKKFIFQAATKAQAACDYALERGQEQLTEAA